MPIGNITQTMSTISPPPHRGVDVQTVFVNKQEDFQDHLVDITIDELNTLKDQLNTRIGEINSTATTMNGYADTASAGASTATTKAGEASTSASGALTSKNQASTFATNSSNSATKASQWADNNYNVAVETGKYSAKHWSTVAQNTAASVSNFGFKNYIINGNFDIWQRGTSQTTTGYGSDDRWSNENNISTKTHSLVNATNTERALFNSSKFSRTTCVTGGTATSLTVKHTKIEDVTKLAGKTVTLSFWAKADSNRNIAIEFQQVFGTGGSPSAEYSNGGQLVALTSTWQKKSITITLPSLIGKTLGTDGVHTSFTRIAFWFDAGSSWSPTYIPTLGTQSGTFDIAQVQLEEGSVATPFEQRPIGLELSLCQRYFRYIYPRFLGYVTAGGEAFMDISFSTMRVTPTTTPTGVAGSILNTSAVNWSIETVGNSNVRVYVIATTASMTSFTKELTLSAEL